MSSIKIRSCLSTEPVTGSCVFPFEGYFISVSNVFPHASDRVMVLDAEGQELFTSYTVEEAVQFIQSKKEQQS